MGTHSDGKTIKISGFGNAESPYWVAKKAKEDEEAKAAKETKEK